MIEVKNLFKAIEDKDKDAFKKESASLASLGYIPRIAEDGSVDCVFAGPLSAEDKQDLKDYLDNLYVAVTKEPEKEEEEEEDKEDKEVSPVNAYSHIPTIGIVLIALAALFVVYHSSKRQTSGYVVS